jgi:hypothetical protein
VKLKAFEVIPPKLPSGKSPASALEELLNGLLAQRLDLRVVATHMNAIVASGFSVVERVSGLGQMG